MDFDYKVGDKILIVKDGLLRKAESPKQKEPWTITTIHTNGPIRNTRGTKSECLNVQRVEPFSKKLENRNKVNIKIQVDNCICLHSHKHLFLSF